MNRAKTEAERMALRQAAAEKRRALIAAEKSLSAENRAAMLAAAGAIRTADGAELSTKNQIMIIMQAHAHGITPSLVGGFRQWLKVGRVVSKGAHGLLICYPKTKKDDNGADVVGGFGWSYVFDISQTRRSEEAETELENEAEKSENDKQSPIPAPSPVAADPSPISAQSVSQSAECGDDMAAIMAAIAAA